MEKTMRLAIFGAALIWAAPAFAQERPGPPNVNDCTLINDPVALRACLDRSRIDGLDGLPAGALPPDPFATGSVAPEPLTRRQLEAAGGTRVEPRRKGHPQVSVEQVAPRKKRPHR
jgi:hypothetical protein